MIGSRVQGGEGHAGVVLLGEDGNGLRWGIIKENLIQLQDTKTYMHGVNQIGFRFINKKKRHTHKNTAQNKSLPISALIFFNFTAI